MDGNAQLMGRLPVKALQRLAEGHHMVVQAAMRHSGFRVYVRNFNLLSCPQSASLDVQGGQIFKSRRPFETSRTCLDLLFLRHDKRSTPHHFDRIIVSHGLGNLSGAQ
jgi:hypothetical protein